jgi:hypothetical protein
MIISGLAIVELGFRRVLGTTFMNGQLYFLAHSDYLPGTLTPNMKLRSVRDEYDVTYQTNALGYRGEFPKSIRKPAGVKRAILLGDSFTLGWGIEESKSFAGILTARFKTKGVEIINAGYHACYSPDAYYAYVVKEGLELQPDLLIIYIFTGNDWDDMEANRWFAVDENGGPTRIETERLLTGVDGRFINHLAPYESAPLVRNSYVLTSFVRQADRVRRHFQPARKEIKPDNKGLAVLRAFDSIERKVPIVYFIIPSSEYYSRDVNPQYRTFIAARHFAATHEYVVTLLSQQAARKVIDLAPFLEKSDYLQQDGHFTGAGNEIVAEKTVPFIERLLTNRQSVTHLDTSVITR